MVWLRPPALVLVGKEIYHRENEHPDQVDEVPVKTARFHVLRRKLRPAKSGGDDPQVQGPDSHVRHVKAGQAEKRRTEERNSPGIGRGSYPLVNQTQPFPEVKNVESD